MKTILLHVSFLLLTSSTFGQTQILKEYDFDKGGYYILGTRSESDRNSLYDSLGEFYTDDVNILNTFKNTWTFSKPGKKYACGYHYTIFVCKGGHILKSIRVNLTCEELVTDEGYFYFDTNLLRQFYGQLKKPYSQRHTFKTITEARKFRLDILKDTTLIMTPNPCWTEYEGSFQFTYKCPEGTTECLDEEETIIKSIEAELKKKYPDENFMLENAGGSLTEIYLEITCNQSLSDKFDLYYRDIQCNSGKWETFDLNLVTYSTNKHE
ncbi:MAG: hypothetical protein ACYC1Q_11280 [Bacteroidia bacterium]